MNEQEQTSGDNNPRKASEHTKELPKTTGKMPDKSIPKETENLKQLMKTRENPTLLIPQEGNKVEREKSDGLTTEEPELPVMDEQPEGNESSTATPTLNKIDEILQRQEHERNLTEIPDIPETWSLEQSVKKVQGIIYKWKKMTAEIMKELWVAREILTNPDRAPDGTFIPSEFTWSKYCEEIGHTRQVVNRWLRAWFNPDGEKSEIIDVAYVTKEIECPMSGRKFRIVCKEVNNANGVVTKHSVKYLDTGRYDRQRDNIKDFETETESENEGN